MKKLVTVICIFIGMMLFPATAYADSPLTSSDIYRAYLDHDIVKEALKSQKINSEIAKYLADSNNPIDIKAAVINALYQEWETKTNAEDYCRAIYHKSLKNIKMNDLNADQLFCIGYLLSLDKYENPTVALKYLELAKNKDRESYTIALIKALTEAMNPKKNIWSYVEPIRKDSRLIMDMRQDALNIILDYMASYCESDQIVVSKNNVMVNSEKSLTIYLYGTSNIDDNCPYVITEQSPKVCTALTRNKYGTYYITLTGVENGASSITIENNEGKKININFTVVSNSTYCKLTNSLALYIGNKTTYIDKTKYVLADNEKPFLMNKNKYIPLQYCSKAIGASYKYDRKAQSYKFSYGNDLIILKKGSNTASVNTKAYSLTQKPTIKNKIWFITEEDFVNIFNKKCIYYNGLIFIIDNARQMDAITDDYILDEIATMITNGNTKIHEPIAFVKDGKYGYKDYEGHIIIEPKFKSAKDFNDGLAAVSMIDADGQEKFGFIDLNGKYVIEPTYKKAQSFASGLAPVLNKEGTLWGYIDVTGKLMIPYKYSDCFPFSEGLAAVQVNQKCGFINKTGEYVIKPIYDSVKSFYYGLTAVTQGGKKALMKSSGVTVLYYDNGDIYMGEEKEGDASGSGVYTWTDGTQYIGEFLKGRLNGRGKCIYIDGIILDGYWVNDVYQGE